MPEAELRHIRKKVTMVFQSGALFDSLQWARTSYFRWNCARTMTNKTKRTW